MFAVVVEVEVEIVDSRSSSSVSSGPRGGGTPMVFKPFTLG